MQAAESRTRRLLLALIVAVIAIVPFLPALHGHWIYDDHSLIEGNPVVHSLHWIGRWFTNDFWATDAQTMRNGNGFEYWRPLIIGSYAVDWRLSGGNPVWFHVMNTVWHGAVAALAFVTLRRWIGATWPAFLAAVLFAVHPTKAESVAWIAGRTDVLCMLFALLATEGIGRRLRGARGGLALEILGTIGAYLAKEQALVLAAFAAVEAWVALGRPALDRAAIKRCIVVALPQAGVAVGYLVIRAMFLPVKAQVGASSLGLVDRVACVLETIGRFVALTLAPHDLSIQQALVNFRHLRPVHDDAYVAIGAIALVALGALAVAARRRWPAVTVGIGFYLVTLLPTSNVVPTQMITLISERFLYLPLLGAALVAGAVLEAQDATWRRRGYALAAACAVALVALAASRSADFVNEDELWARELRMHPDSRQAGLYFVTQAIEQRNYTRALEVIGKMEKAAAPYDRDARLDLEVASNVVFALGQLTPDHDVAGLRKLDAFCEELLDHARVARLQLRGVGLAIGMTKAHLAMLPVYMARLESYRADFSSRLGDDASALRLAAASRETCQWCPPEVNEDALLHARTGQYDAAYQILDAESARVGEPEVAAARDRIDAAHAAATTAATATGPAQVDARAQELAYLQLWGRAFDTLVPYKAEILRVPNLARTFAELAYRAGESATAREVLGTLEPPNAIDADLHTWAVEMGWQSDEPPAPR